MYRRMQSKENRKVKTKREYVFYWKYKFKWILNINYKNCLHILVKRKAMCGSTAYHRQISKCFLHTKSHLFQKTKRGTRSKPTMHKFIFFSGGFVKTGARLKSV